MKKTFLKFSVLLLGAVIMVSSCVKTEESDEVKALRKARVEQMTLANELTKIDIQIKEVTLLTNRNTLIRDSIKLLNELKLNSLVYVKDSANYNSQIASFYAQLQANNNQLQANKDALQKQIVDAQRTLSDSKRLLDITLKAEQVQAMSNPVLASLLNDYDVYYNGGTLDDGGIIALGIYDLTEDNLDKQQDILDLNIEKDNLTNIIEQYKNDSIAYQNIANAYTNITKNLTAAKAGSGIATALANAQTQLSKSIVDYEKAKIDYDVANAAFLKAQAKLAQAKLDPNSTPAILAALRTDSTNTAKTNNTAFTTKNNAEDIMDIDQDAFDALNDGLEDIDSEIALNETDRLDAIDDLNGAINTLKYLYSGYNVNTNTFVTNEIAKLNKEIAYNNTLIAKYQAKADALKVKIDAQ